MSNLAACVIQLTDRVKELESELAIKDSLLIVTTRHASSLRFKLTNVQQELEASKKTNFVSSSNQMQSQLSATEQSLASYRSSSREFAKQFVAMEEALKAKDIELAAARITVGQVMELNRRLRGQISAIRTVISGDQQSTDLVRKLAGGDCKNSPPTIKIPPSPSKPMVAKVEPLTPSPGDAKLSSQFCANLEVDLTDEEVQAAMLNSNAFEKFTTESRQQLHNFIQHVLARLYNCSGNFFEVLKLKIFKNKIEVHVKNLKITVLRAKFNNYLDYSTFHHQIRTHINRVDNMVRPRSNGINDRVRGQFMNSYQNMTRVLDESLKNAPQLIKLN